MADLTNETALVTGASRGIGRAIAVELGRRGARVIGTATSEAGSRAIDEAFAAEGIQGRGVVLDVASAGSVEACLKDVEGREGTPSILVNNAGVTTLVECGPGKVLTSLNRRIERRPELAMLAVEDPEGLAAALAACREKDHG